ncbi:glycosyltransferase [bacterium]|nr:glycosyltransferase [bacterium]
MKILFVAMKYDYGISERGFSFEHFNFYESLVGMGHDVEYFDFMDLYRKHGSVRMTSQLLERVRTTKPDLVFSVLFTDEFDHTALRRLRREISIPIVNWFSDDHWRYETFSRHWADCFTHVVTTDEASVQKYIAAGETIPLLSQWGVNHYRYTAQQGPMRHMVSFVGQPYGKRRSVIRTIRQRGIDVCVRGTGWNVGLHHRIFNKLGILSPEKYEDLCNSTRIDQQGMVDMFRSTRINLNLSDAYRKGYRKQIKARTFEIPGCGGFQLCEETEHLSDYFIPDQEIVTFTSTEEMLEKIHYFLSHDHERNTVASSGHQRVLRDHTYEKRFQQLFASVGISS